MKEIRFVDVGEGITEGKIQKWLVNDGDKVDEDESILQVETDKAVVNVPSPIDGFLKIVAKENSIVKVGDLIAQVGTKDELGGALAPQPQQPAQKTPQPQQQQAQPVQSAPAPQPSSPAPSATHDIITTPYVRKLAKDMNIDLSKVNGTGPNGRILESDVKNFSAKPAVQQTTAPAPSSAPNASSQPTTTSQPVQKQAPPKSNTFEDLHKGEIERIPMSQTRKAIARNMEASWTIPRATSMDMINATKLFNMVAREKPNLAKDLNIHLTFLPFIIKATIAAIKENPNFNASYDGEKSEIIRKNYYNIGLAAEAPDGLKVVVIKNADRKSIVELAKEIQDLSEKVKNKTVTIDEMQDSTFTITNIGSLGGGFLAVPMINYPNVAILGVLKMKDMPIVEDGMVKVAKIMPFSLVFDHRVVDGAEAVKFGNTLIKYLEDPELLDMF
jgi:pyruvate dehydrogenase E2 component (dihydrolipoamide acetyltransferase)